MKNRYVGYLIIIITFVFFIIVMSFNQALATIVNTTCTHGAACPMQITLRTQQWISYSLMGLLAIVGVFVSFFLKDTTSAIKEKDSKELSEKEKKEKLNDLDDKEREIMNIILREKGSVYQSDIVKEVSASKVKITRVLDKLEGKGLIERKRRGMTNIVVLK
ncbi:MAG: MarR family transcriptional regulator [archaeon]